jgi:hypothetical protein
MRYEDETENRQLGGKKSGGGTPNTVRLKMKSEELNRRWTRMDADQEGYSWIFIWVYLRSSAVKKS